MNKRSQKYVKYNTLKKCLVFVLVQILIVMFFYYGFMEGRPIDLNNCITKTIRIDKIEYGRGYNEYVLNLYADGIWYRVANTGADSDLYYSIREMYECIKPGDEVSIVYTTDLSFFVKINLIIDIRSDTVVYLDAEFVNTQLSYGFVFIVSFFLHY